MTKYVTLSKLLYFSSGTCELFPFKNGAKILTRGSKSYILLRIMPIISKSSLKKAIRLYNNSQYEKIQLNTIVLSKMLLNSSVHTVLILSRMLLLNYLDLRLYVCLNQNSVVLTKKLGPFGPFFVLWCFQSVNLRLS